MYDGSCCFEVNEHYLGERYFRQSLATSNNQIWMHSVSGRSSVCFTSVYSDQVYSDQAGKTVTSVDPDNKTRFTFVFYSFNSFHL